MAEKFTIRKANGHQVACVREIPPDAQRIAVVLHGFTSSKESPTVQMLLRRLPAAGIGVIAIDQPAHGQEESHAEELRIENCLDSLEAAEAFVVEQYPGREICYFGSSFGAYIIALYISMRPHRGRKAFFRSAAVNMPSLFIKEHPTEKEKELLRELEEKGYMQPSLDLGSPVKVTKGMMQDLSECDLFERFDPDRFGRHVLGMAHGAEDDVIDPAQARAFAERFAVPVTFFEHEGHSLSNNPATPERVADLAIRLYNGHDGHDD